VPPALDLAREAALQKAALEMIGAGLLESAKDVSEGGLAVTLAKAGFAANIGVDVSLESEALPLECALFGEDATRIVLSCDAANVPKIREIAIRYGLSAKAIGTTTDGKLQVNVDGQTAIAAPVSRLKESWSNALVKALHVETAEELVPQILEKS
jgi:phosphoribosylformylglycinamidine synthase subunit PurL